MQSNGTRVGLKSLLLTILTFAFALGLVEQAHAYSFTILDIGDQSFTQAQGINDSGEVVGTFIGSSRLQGFMRDTKGVITTFGVPGGIATSANGINNSGDIVGFVTIMAPPGPPFLTQGFKRDKNGAISPILNEGGVLSVTLRSNHPAAARIWRRPRPESSRSVRPK